MKITITLKDPDGVYDSLMYAATEMVSPELSNDERDEEIERERDTLIEATKDFIEYREYVYLEFDTETKTVRVLPKSEW